MKKKLIIIAAILSLLTGCSENLQVNEPQVGTTAGPNWITLPQRSGGLSTENSFSVTKEIKGKDGGELRINEYYNGPNGEIKIIAKLKFDRNAFIGTQDITMTIDDVNGTVTYSPPMSFVKPAHLELRFEGLDLSEINTDSVDFVYHDPLGFFGPIDYRELKVEIPRGVLELKDGKIPHFSRYGFSR
jgi:hypothetical protein